MTALNLDKILSNIKSLTNRAKKILVVTSRPVDPDCVGTGLALEWWLSQLGKQVKVVSFFCIPQTMNSFPDIKKILLANPSSFDLDRFDLMILVDGSSWNQFFGDSWDKIISSLDLSKVVNLDHHMPDAIQSAVPDRCCNVITSSTAQVLYDYFFKKDKVAPPKHVAEYLYLALLYDSRFFKNELYPGEYQFAEDLIALGVDHLKAVDTKYDLQEIKFLVWAVENTEFIPSLQMTMLAINKKSIIKLKKDLGENWICFDGLYKETIQRQIKGYNYGIILNDNLDGSIKFNWRTRNFGSCLSISEIAQKAGFRAGGHRNAGGGNFKGSIANARNRLLKEMRKALNV